LKWFGLERISTRIVEILYAKAGIVKFDVQMRLSAGILMYRYNDDELQVMLVHPGGPFWKNKEVGTWSIPKGEFSDDENALVAAKREFKEETGQEAPGGNVIELKPVKQNPTKMVYAFAVDGDLDVTSIRSNLCDVEWPPKSGKIIQVPEVDKAGWFNIEEAKQKILAGQSPLLNDLVEKLKLE
jgi:predicted NUDIX family NTP pyrophosphohydrolase